MSDKRQRLSEVAWQALLAKQPTSGLSVAAFCAHEGVSPASFYQWRTRLRSSVPQPPVKAAPGFVDLGALGAIGSTFTLRLELSGGLVLTLGRD